MLRLFTYKTDERRARGSLVNATRLLLSLDSLPRLSNTTPPICIAGFPLKILQFSGLYRLIRSKILDPNQNGTVEVLPTYLNQTCINQFSKGKRPNLEGIQGQLDPNKPKGNYTRSKMQLTQMDPNRNNGG